MLPIYPIFIMFYQQNGKYFLRNVANLSYLTILSHNNEEFDVVDDKKKQLLFYFLYSFGKYYVYNYRPY